MAALPSTCSELLLLSYYSKWLLSPTCPLPSSEQVLVFWCGGSLCPSLPRLLVQLVLASLLHILLTLIPSSLPIILMVAAARDL